LQSSLDEQAKRLTAAERERDALQNSKRTADRQLAQIRRELDRVRQQGREVPVLNRRIEELEGALTDKQTQEARHAKDTQRLVESAEKLRDRLDEILVHRESLQDELTILRLRWEEPQGKETLSSTGSHTEIQHALADAKHEHQTTLAYRDARLEQLERSLEAKEKALQVAYQAGREAKQQAQISEAARAEEMKSRELLNASLKRLERDLEASQARAKKLEQRLANLEALDAP
jgi:chromosome segregation ATPase